jgi:hypothetical protein
MFRFNANRYKYFPLILQLILQLNIKNIYIQIAVFVVVVAGVDFLCEKII